MENILVFKYKDKVVFSHDGQKLIRYDEQALRMSERELQEWYLKEVRKYEK